MTLRKPNRARRAITRGLLGLPLAAAAAGIAYSNYGVDHAVALPHALVGERRELAGRAGKLSYYTDGQGEPLLLIHSINAAASAYEVRPLYDHYRNSRRVYALDLPGFGFSERSDREYSPRLYVDAILDMLDQIHRDTGAEEVDALALSLGCEFLARAASENPHRFDTIALVAPTGMRANDRLYGPDGSVRGNQAVKAGFDRALWGLPFYDALVSRPSQRYFLEKTFGSKEAVDQGMLEYDYLTAHQPGAQHAPYAFIAGLLFSADISRVYDALEMPVFAAHGVRGDFTDYGRLREYAARGNWTTAEFQTGAMPYFEVPEQFITAYDAFLARAVA